jgi:hypothetical protein
MLVFTLRVEEFCLIAPDPVMMAALIFTVSQVPFVPLFSMGQDRLKK